MPVQNRAAPWAQWPLEERVEHTTGQVDALFAFMLALIKTHPNPQELANEFLAIGALQISRVLNQAVSEKYIEGQAECRERIAALLRAKGVTLPPGWESGVT